MRTGAWPCREGALPHAARAARACVFMLAELAVSSTSAYCLAGRGKETQEHSMQEAKMESFFY